MFNSTISYRLKLFGLVVVYQYIYHQVHVHVCVFLAHLHLKKVMMKLQIVSSPIGKTECFWAALHSMPTPFFLGGGLGGVFGVFNYKINYNSTDRLMTLKSKRSEKFLFCCFCQGFQVFLQWGISTFHFMNMQLHQKYMLVLVLAAASASGLSGLEPSNSVL